MTVHARQLARLCRERMSASDAGSPVQRQPEQQQMTTDQKPEQRRPHEVAR